MSNKKQTFGCVLCPGLDRGRPGGGRTPPRGGGTSGAFPQLIASVTVLGTAGSARGPSKCSRARGCALPDGLCTPEADGQILVEKNNIGSPHSSSPVLAYIWTLNVQAHECCLPAVRVQISLGLPYFLPVGRFLLLSLCKVCDLCPEAVHWHDVIPAGAAWCLSAQIWD